MKAISSTAWLPQWTRRVALEGSGRDPLGLSRVSDELTSILLRSIITTTDRARYYSFYTWVWSELVDLQEKAGEPLSPERLQVEFQRREAAFAVASLWGRKSDLPIVGIRQVESRASTPGDEDEELDLEFRVLPSNSLGGFGQYYGGCLHGLELVGYDPETGFAEKPTPLGQELARAFASATAQAPFIANPDCRRKRRVPRGVLKKSRELFSLDALTVPSAK